MRVTHVDRLPPAEDPRYADWPRGGAATIGVFDGVHLGHQRILSALCKRARACGGPSVVLTFAVHPVVILRGLEPRLITSLPHRLRLFENHGVDECFVLPFDDDVRRLEAGDFANLVFRQLLDLRALVLGRDARIGRDRGGDVAFVQAFCRHHGIDLDVVDDYVIDGVRVSSSRVRAAIVDGDLERARRMLGRGVSVLGTVIRGDGRGRRIGIPTANLDLHHEIRPPNGVYAAVADVAGTRFPAVLNIGVRPTFAPHGEATVEAHLLGFEGDLYGRDLELVLRKRIRGERRFDSPDQLVAQIQRDIQSARRLLVDVA